MPKVATSKKKAAVNEVPNFKALNMHELTRALKDKYPNLYPRVQLYTRGVKDTVSKEILTDLLERITAESDTIKKAIKADIKTAPAEPAK